jgi:predicted RNA polymerase sigma factor
MTDQGIQDVLRPLVPQVLGALVRRYGRFDACEDAVQEALLAAAVQWPAQGVPANPVAWLQTVAVRRLTDDWRSESSRRNRETAFFVMDPDQIGARGQSAPDVAVAADDTLKLLSAG